MPERAQIPRLLQARDEIVQTGHSPHGKALAQMGRIVGAKTAGPKITARHTAEVAVEDQSIASADFFRLFSAFAHGGAVQSKKERGPFHQAALPAMARCPVAADSGLIQ